MTTAIDRKTQEHLGEQRALAMAADGRSAVALDRSAVRLIGGGAVMSAPGVLAVAMLDGEVWVVARTGCAHTLHRVDRTGDPIAPPLALGALGIGVRLEVTRVGLRSALIEGERGVYVRDGGVLEDLGARGPDCRVLMGGRGVMERRGDTMALRRSGHHVPLALPRELAAGRVVGGGLVFDGACAMIEVEAAGARTALVYELGRGTLRSQARLGDGAVFAVAERTGIVVVGRGPHIARLDLRAGRCVGERVLASPMTAAAIDADGKRLLVIDAEGQISEIETSIASRLRREAREAAERGDRDEHADADARNDNAARVVEGSAETDGAGPTAASDGAMSAAAPDGAVPAAASDGAMSAAAPDGAGRAAASDGAAPAAVFDAAGTDELDRGLAEAETLALVALGEPPAGALAGDALAAYLDDVCGWIAALCGVAQARMGDGAEDRPGASVEHATAAARAAEARLDRWCGPGVPHCEVADELGLSPLATKFLLVVAAPQIWGELAGEYAACVGNPERALIDELLLAHLLEAGSIAARSAIGRELDADAPLVRSGAVELDDGMRPYAGLRVHPAIARRLAGAPPAGDPAAPDRPVVPLHEIIGPRAAIANLARQLARPSPGPARVVLRGRAGAGRRTLARALAAQAGRAVAMVAADGSGDELEAALAQRLRDVALRGDLPCVDLDGVTDDPAARVRIGRVLDAHPRPLLVRAPRTGDLPLAPGYCAVDFAPLDETDRRTAWQRMLRAHGFDAGPASALASRFSVGPAVMQRACAAVAAGPEPAALEPALAGFVRQHRSSRIASIATRVERLASWDDLIVPDDIADGLRELCARVQHRGTVLEAWGLAGVASTARGVTALFQGGPGTGKTMAAEVVARALGYELWRVDLSRVVSKWIGETEKNLATVFDAAEDGEIVLLFDEADSLFAKRTEVKSSHDRSANLETNYLLQRLDAFTGIAILTTNHGTAIDPAFRRRLSMQAVFPFPDEADRERLWRALLPRTVPTAGDLDLGELARRFQLTGGYIRNAVLRAAYLAASRGTPLSTADLERAVRAEFLAHGKVSASGALG